MNPTKLVVAGCVTLAGLAFAWCAVAAPMGELIRAVDRTVGQLSRVEVAKLSAEPLPQHTAGGHGKQRQRRPSKRQRTARQRVDAPPKPPPTPKNHVVKLDRNAPNCDDIWVYIVSDWVDGGALATVAHGRKSRGHLVRIGSRFAGHQVIEIGVRGNGMGPAVWLLKGDEICQARLFDSNPTRARKRYRSARHKKKRHKKKRRGKRRR